MTFVRVMAYNSMDGGVGGGGGLQHTQRFRKYNFQTIKF